MYQNFIHLYRLSRQTNFLKINRINVGNPKFRRLAKITTVSYIYMYACVCVDTSPISFCARYIYVAGIRLRYTMIQRDIIVLEMSERNLGGY